MKVTKEGMITDLIKELDEEVVFLAGHLFRANWQQTQFAAMRNAVPFLRNTVGMVLDFAENFTCSFQDEIQAAHWYHEQVTVHPIVSYYLCPVCAETVTESLVFISDDKRHDFHAVHSFTCVAMDHLKNTRGIQLEHVIQWTDGCSSQYKSKGPFSDISHAMEDFGCTWERNFFGSWHGKGPADGESAVVKHGASTAVRSGAAVISNARDLFDFCFRSKLNKQPDFEGRTCQSHFFRSFFWVPQFEISRTRNRSVKTLKGTRTLHSIRCVERNVLYTRKLSCFCDACKSGVGDCIQVSVVGDWTRQALRPDVPNPQVPAVAPESPAPSLPPESPESGPQSPALPAAASQSPESPPPPESPAAAPQSPPESPAAAPQSPESPPPPKSPAAAPQSPESPPPPESPAAAPETLAITESPPAFEPSAPESFLATLSPTPPDSSPVSPLPPSDASESPLPNIKPDTFVKVNVQTEGRQRRTLQYFAKVLKVEKNDIFVHYFVQKTQNSYVWSDQAWVTPTQIIAVVNRPTLAPGRGLAFIFD